jgi:hypothetical protein
MDNEPLMASASEDVQESRTILHMAHLSSEPGMLSYVVVHQQEISSP